MKLSFVAKMKPVLATSAYYMVMKRRYAWSKIKLLDGKKACACYICLLHIMATLYVPSVKSGLIAYGELKCYYY